MLTPDRITSTTCPYCGVGCTLELHIKDDFIFKVTSPFESVVNHGNLCVKGRFGYDFIYSKDRVTTPLIRKVKQEPGKRTQAFNRDEWREATWDEALELVADRLTEIYKRDGSEAMAVYACAKATNEDNYLLQKMYRALFRTNNVDHCTRLCHAASVTALIKSLGTTAMSNTAAEVVKSDVFIVTGSNTTENHPIIANYMKAAVMQNGAKLIVIDPRRIELCNFATLWLPLKPGTNVVVFSAMAHVIVKEGLINRIFIETRTEGYKEFLKSVEKFTPEYAEMVSGVDRNLIIEAARMYAKAKNGAIFWGMGISQLSQGTSSALALIHLALLTGHIGREGTGLNPLRGQNNVQGASDAGAMPFHYPGYMEVVKEENAVLWEKAWNVEAGGLSRKRGLTTTEILSNAKAGGVRALYIMGENPMMTEPNLNETRHHIEQLEFLVAQDVFINESGAFADVFLPAVSFAEKDGTFTNTDRRIQRVHQAIQPRGEARPDWKILCDVAQRIEKRLGRASSAKWDYGSPEEIYREMAGVVPAFNGINYGRIKKVGLQYPVPTADHPGTPFLFSETFPAGGGKFFPLDYIPVAEPPDDQYPLILTTGRLLEHWHGGTMTRHSQLDALYPEALVEISEVDAAQFAIRTGDTVRVSSRRGSVVLRARVTEKTNAGVVFVPMHFAEAAANLLTIDTLDAQAKIPEFKACAVKIEIAKEAELAKPEAKQARGRY
ncbi:MAG: formate dehydrogenase subunit alpha [Chloroflexi bacterium]|nr:formate dehydrogenase subunit alpha [Chloroflexota bacterium]